MDLELSEEESDLRDNVRAVLSGLCPPAAVRAVYEGKGDAASIWTKMVELSWPALSVPEEYGGLGMGFVEIAIVAEELGRAVVPGPFLATVTQFAPAVRELGRLGDPGQPSRSGRPSQPGDPGQPGQPGQTGQTGQTGELAVDQSRVADLLGRVANGEVTGTVALAEDGRWEAPAVGATATETAGGWALHGTKSAVLHGADVDEVLVVARAAGTSGPEGLGAFVVPRAELAATPRPVIDPTLPLADLVLDGVVVAADRVLAAPGAAGVAGALDRAGQEATVALATGTVGACRAIFEQTLEYAKVREQYGRPIGSFQALKHRLADVYLAVERATSLCYFAALTIAEEDPRRAQAASMAKAAAGECQQLVVRDGIQLHGGIGVTWEHDLHFLLKRALSGDALYGNAVHHRARLARTLGFVPATDEPGEAGGAEGSQGAKDAKGPEEAGEAGEVAA